MTQNLMDDDADAWSAPFDAQLRLHRTPAPRPALGGLEARILAQAALPLAARRRALRATIADTLAAWGRVAVPMAAAAALFAALLLSRVDTSTVADDELHDSDPAALLSALEAGDGGALAAHVIGARTSDSDVEPR